MNRPDMRRVACSVATVMMLGGCVSDGFHAPDAGPDPIVREAPTTRTGSRIVRGKDEAVRDSSQRIDVFTEQDLEKQRPVSTRDAVQRATRGF